MKKYNFLVLSLMFFLILPNITWAETIIDEGTIDNDLILKKSESPYIIDKEIYVHSGHKILMESGSELIFKNNGSIFSDSPIEIEDGEDRTKISGSGFLYIGSSTSTIHNTVFDGIPISFYDANVEIHNSLFDNIGFSNIYIDGDSILDIEKSIISNSNKTGIEVSAGSKIKVKNCIFLSLGNGIIFNSKISLVDLLISNVFALTYESKIENSSFENILGWQVNNKRVDSGATMVDARNNWWGDVSGPLKITGLVDYDPWLLEPPLLEEEIEEEIEKEKKPSVIFIPGIQSSRLSIKDNGDFVKKWEPLSNVDVKSLYLNSSGESINKTVTPTGIIDSVFTVGIYDGFIDNMNSLVKNGVIKEWKALDYDWRKDVKEIASDLLPELVSFASSSLDKKVKIITHSNGGLVLKGLLLLLKEKSLLDLVDGVINVAVPQTGTPKAIGSLLHGDGQELAYGFILDKPTAKGFAEYMNGAFGLVPSGKYFDESDKPVIEFSDISKIPWFPKAYGVNISDVADLKDFLVSSKDGDNRTKPSLSDKEKPNILDVNFINSAEDIHGEIDSIENLIPNTINIIGTDLPTPSGIKYSQKEEMDCSILGCFKEYRLSRAWNYSKSGDGTVISKSAESAYGDKYYFDIGEYNSSGFLGSNSNISHANILNAPPVFGFIESILKSEDENEDITLPEFISLNNKDDTNEEWMKFKTHSPVDMYIEDNEGRKSGVISESNGIKRVVNEISNAIVEDIDSSEILIPENILEEEYSLHIKGNDTGFFGLTVSLLDDKLVEATSTEYVDIPVSVNTLATLPIKDTLNLKKNIISLDFDGDGIEDSSIKSGDKYHNNSRLFKFIKDKIKHFKLDKKIKNKIKFLIKGFR